jgi:TonB family protein
MNRTEATIQTNRTLAAGENQAVTEVVTIRLCRRTHDRCFNAKKARHIGEDAMDVRLIAAVFCLAAATVAHAAEGQTVQLGALTVTAKLVPTTPPPVAAGEAPPLRYYPEQAQANRIEADVMLMCQIVEGGGTSDCRVKSESVSGQGFGEKALLVWFQVKQPVKVGGDVWNAGTALVPIKFRMEKPR